MICFSSIIHYLIDPIPNQFALFCMNNSGLPLFK
jgi:hypothetical protein